MARVRRKRSKPEARPQVSSILCANVHFTAFSRVNDRRNTCSRVGRSDNRDVSRNVH